MVSYLLDADTVIAAVKGRLPVVLRLSRLKPGEIAVSAISRLEAEAALRRAPRASAKFSRLLREFFGAVKVLEFGAVEAAQASQIQNWSAGSPEAPSGLDLLVAATALAHQRVLVTERPQRFASVNGLELESWAK